MQFIKLFTEAAKLKWSSALVAAGIYGGWAYSQNLNIELSHRLMITFGQATLSFIATFFFSSLIYWGVSHNHNKQYTWYIVAGLASASYIVILIFLHSLIKTPNIIQTIIPIASLATAYAFYFAKKSEEEVKVST